MLIQEKLQNSKYSVIGIFGMRGSGKTYLSTKLQMPTDKVYYIDIVGAMRHELDNQKVAIVEVDTLISANQLNQFFTKMPEQKQFCFDISSMHRKNMVAFTDTLCDYLMQSGEECSLIVDECGEVLPQDMSEYSHRLESVARMGRNKGIINFTATTKSK